MTQETTELELLELLEAENEYLRVNKLELFDPYPYQVDFMTSKSGEVALRAGNQQGKCGTVSSLIETIFGSLPFWKIFGKRILVKTPTGYNPVKAWVKKPAEECYRITMSDGQWFECPNGHRIKSISGFFYVSDLIESLPLSAVGQLETSLLPEPCLRVLGYFLGGRVGVRHCIGRLRDYFLDYLACRDLDDEQFLLEEDSVQVFSPSLVDVRQHNFVSFCLGGLVSICTYSLSLCKYLLSSLGVDHLTLGRFVSFLKRVFSFVFRYKILSNESDQQLFDSEYHHQSSSEALLHQFESLPSLLTPISIDGNHIVSIRSVGFKTLYDFEVDGHEYIAGGMIHHNTLSGTAWDAMDLTGIYPDWFTGIRTDSPISLVVGCVNNDKTRDIIQKELFGDPIEWEAELGSGWIPKHCIGKIQKKRGVPDAFYNVRIKHFTDGVFDGWSKIVFLAYEMGKSTWMAHKADVIHLDEEPPADILEQASRSSIATGGRIRITFTPENGITSVVKQIQNDWELHTSEWSDVSGGDFEINLEGEIFEFKTIYTLNGRPGHLTKDKVLAAARKIPVHSMKMRMRGIPVLGSGLIFRFPEEQIKIDPIEFPDHWLFLDAMDFGGISSEAHPTAFARGAYDPTNDCIIIYDGFKIKGKEIPEVASHIVMKPNSGVIPVAWPHDGNKMGKDGTTRDQYYSAGVNMCDTHVTNPPMDGQIEGKGGNRIMPGIDEMSMRMNDGRFKVVSNVGEFFEEYRGYHMKDGKVVDLDDDFISACRYITMYIRHAEPMHKVKIKFNTRAAGGSGWMGG